MARVLLDQRSRPSVPRPQRHVCRGRDNQMTLWCRVGYHARDCILQVSIRRCIGRIR